MLALKIENLAVSFPGLATPVLAIDALEIAAGSRMALTGGSGSGKSTLINIIAGLERVRNGRVLWGADNIADLSEGRRDRWRASNIGLVMQDFHLFPGLSAFDNILLPARLSRVANPELLKRAHALLSTVGLKRPEQHVETMSRGEMQRVAIARALLRRPGVIIADEPTASLDLGHQISVLETACDFASAGGMVLAILHDLNLAAEFADHLVVLHHGRVVAEGACHETVSDEMISSVYGIAGAVGRVPAAHIPYVLPQSRHR